MNPYLNEGVRIASRDQWGALPPIVKEPMAQPIVWVRYILDTGTPRCKTHEECSKILQELQLKHMEQGLGDIRYNFLVSDEGVVYEGRGWKYKPPLDETLAEYDARFMEIALIGDYTKETRRKDWLNTAMSEAQFELLVFGEENKYLSSEYQYIPLRPELVAPKDRVPPEPTPLWDWTVFDPEGTQQAEEHRKKRRQQQEESRRIKELKEEFGDD